jgi:hypothetical protein
MLRKSAPVTAALHYRQGDILIRRIVAIPGGAVRAERNSITKSIVLAEGERAGHLHEIRNSGAEAYRLAEGLYLSVEEEVEIVHPEHSRIALLPGTYEVIRQVEYTRKEFVQVSD